MKRCVAIDYIYGYMPATEWHRRSQSSIDVNKNLVTAAKEKRINLSAFLESKLEELLILKNRCRGRGSDPRLPDYESGALTN